MAPTGIQAREGPTEKLGLVHSPCVAWCLEHCEQEKRNFDMFHSGGKKILLRVLEENTVEY